MLIWWPGMVYRLRVSPSITRVVDWRHKKDLNRCQSFWASVSGDTELSSTTIQQLFFLPLSRRSCSLCWAIAVQKKEVLAGFQRLTQVVGRWIAAVRPYWSDAHFIVVVMYAAASMWGCGDIRALHLCTYMAGFVLFHLVQLRQRWS